MDKQFTASEVRNEASNHWRLSDGPQQTLAGKMLHAYADLLEADEKAVPVKLEYYDAGLLNNFGGGNIDWWWDYIRNELGRAHSFYQSQVDGIMSAPSDAERLAEALRACALNWQEIAAATWRSYSVSASNVDKASAIAHMHCAQDIRKALADHSAQAQLPAASVPDIETMVNRFLSWRLPKPWNPDNGISYTRPNYAHEPAEHDWPTGTNLFDAHQAREMIEYMLAAQENPNG